ncbi:MAG: hypothetical protein M3Q48_17280 [Actinomycetota bacterium]|nr:hypothetical protein [Actinomycetota bacterium]
MTTSTTPAATPAATATAPAEERLTTGWEPDAPVGDTILRRYLFCSAGLFATFAKAAGGRATKAPAFAAADAGRPSGWFNSATLLQPPDPATFHHVVADVERFFQSGTGEAHLWSAWPTPDLTARGWRLVGHPPLLIRPPAALVPPPAPVAVDLVEVADATGLAEWERVAIEGYPLPELSPFVPGALADPRALDDPRLRFTVGREDGEAVSIGTLFTDSGVGCFALGVTLPAARRRGHWLAHAVHRIAAAPDVWMAGVFSDHSRSPAERLGFLPVLRFTLWARDRAR